MAARRKAMEKVASLIQQIEHLVTNPNETELKSFGEFLQNEDISKGELGLWALAKPCQLLPLASISVENLTSVEIFRRLARLPEFVDVLLKVKPWWLESLVGKTGTDAPVNTMPEAVDSSEMLVTSYMLRYGKFSDSTLHYIQPAVVSVIEHPNEAVLRRLSGILAAIPGNVLDHFTDDLLTRLSSVCKDVCVGSIGTKNHIEIMLAQDILAQIAVAFQTPQTPSKSSLETPPGAKFTERCRRRVFKPFSESNASTTLKLTILRLSVFCSKDRGALPDVGLEAIKLAQRTLAPIPMSVRHQWGQRNSRLVEKLISRLASESLDLNIRLEAVVFCVSLLGAENDILPSLKKVATAVLLGLYTSMPSLNSVITTENGKGVADILVCLCSSKAEPNRAMPGTFAVVTKMLSFVVDQCQPWCTNTVNTVVKIHHAKIILQSLHSASKRYGILQSIVEFIQLGYVPDWWGSEVAFPLSLPDGETGNCLGEEFCSRSVDQLRCELANSFSSLLLTSAWQSSKSLQQPETCQRLLNRIRGFSERSPNLLCSNPAYQSMGLTFDSAVIDAQAEAKDLRIRLENETAQRVALENKLATSERLLDEERDACNAVQQYLVTTERECFETAQALRSAREDYVELLQDADRKVEAVEWEWKDKELLLRADYLQRQSELEEKVDQIRATLEQKERDLQAEKQKRTEFTQEMEAALAQSKRETELLRLAIAEKDKALEEADSLRTSLVVLLEGKPE